MSDDWKSPASLLAFAWGRTAALLCWALVTVLGPSAFVPAAVASTLEVKASNVLPGFYRSELARYLAAQMAEARLSDWRFAPAAGDGMAADRVEWSFKLNPYAGGEVRRVGGSLSREGRLTAHRPVTIEARLYLNGEYQTLVEQQAIVEGGPDDPDLAAAVASVTQNLLGPAGAYRAIDTRPGRADRAR
jgi:hypothetical protein